MTGATGLLGATLVHEAVARGHRVIAMARRHGLIADGVVPLRCDLSAPAAAGVLEALPHVDRIVHCAAVTDVDLCESAPSLAQRVNVAGTRQLARFARRKGVDFVYISTDSVFDGRRGGYREDEPPAPLNVYARSKVEGERAVREELPDDRWLIVRTNLHGWNAQPKSSLSEWFLARAERSQRSVGFVDVIFGPLLVNDLGDALLDLVAAGRTGIYHLASRDAISKYEFGALVCREFGFDTRLVVPGSIAEAPLRAERPRNTSLDTTKAASELGRELPTVADGLRRFRELRLAGWPALLRGSFAEAPVAAATGIGS